MFSLSGVERCGATRCGYTSGNLFVSIGGEQRATGRAAASAKVLDGSLTIQETDGSEPNRCDMDVMGFPVARHQEVIVTLGSRNNLTRRFAGTVLSSTDRYETSPALPHKRLHCVDYSWQLNRGEPITGLFNAPADEILIELMETYAPDISTQKVPTGLPTILISFTKERLRSCLDRIARRVGGYWRIDYRKRLRFTLTTHADLTNPRTLTDALSTLKLEPESFSVERDRGQQITRCYFEGAGAAVLAEVSAGETVLPLDQAPAEWYGDVGGDVIIGESQEVLSYTGRVAGGGGSLVGPGVGPSSAPALDLAAGSGVTSGEHEIAVVFKTAAGRSLVGPRATIDVGLVTPPSAAPTAGTPINGTGPDPGAHYYAMSYVTAAGETTPSPVSGTVTTTAGVTDPASAGTLAAGAATGIGSLTPGNSYSCKITYADAAGNETLPSSATGTVTVTASQRMVITGVPYSTDARIVAVHLYVSANGGGGPWTRIKWDLGGAAEYDSITNSTGGGTFDAGFHSLTAAGGGAAAPSANATGTRTVPLTGLQVSPSALVLSKNIYGTAAGGSQLKLVANIAAGATSYNVAVVDASLGANAPTANTAVANQIALSGVPLGSATVTEREIYMTAADTPGGTLRLALTIANNTATTGTITISDASLAGQSAAPSSDTSGLAQPTGQVVKGSTELPVAGTGEFRAAGGWAIVGNGRTLIRYTGIADGELTGIPSSGVGSLSETVAYSTNVTAAPMLVGIPASGARAVENTIRPGSLAHLWITVNNLAAQAEVSALLDPTDVLGGEAGVIADILIDARVSRAEAIARATAHVDLHDDEAVTLTYESTDVNHQPGATVVADLDNGVLVVDETLRVRELASRFDPLPRFTVTASNRRFTYEDLLRKLKENA